MEINKNLPNDVEFLGAYTREQGNLLKKELEINGIPAQIYFPEQNPGLPEWLAVSVYIHPENAMAAIEICKKLGLPADYKGRNDSGGYNWVMPVLIIVAAAMAIYYIYHTYFLR